MGKVTRYLLSALVLTVVTFSLCSGADTPNDRQALKGLKSAKAIFDVRFPDEEKLLFNLNLIKETYEEILQQGVRPRMIVAFRGPGVKLLTRELVSTEVAALIADLKKKGVRIEVCAVATRIFKVDNAALVPDIILVGNVITSYIGYQNKGYALVPMN